MSHSATLPVLLKQLKLSTIAAHWEKYLDYAEQRGWSPAQYLAALCEEEVNGRYTRRIASYLKESKLPGSSDSSVLLSLTPIIIEV